MSDQCLFTGAISTARTWRTFDELLVAVFLGRMDVSLGRWILDGGWSDFTFDVEHSTTLSCRPSCIQNFLTLFPMLPGKARGRRLCNNSGGTVVFLRS